MRVRVRVTNAAAVKHKSVVEQISVALGRRFELIEKICQEFDMVLVDLVPFFELHGIVLVMRDGVMRFIDANLGVGLVGLLLAQRKGEYASDVCTEGQRD